MRLREYATKMGLSYQAAWKQFKNNMIPGAYQLGTGTVIIPDTEIKPEYGVILYARTSSSQNKQLLEAQAERLKNYAAARGYKVKQVIKEFGSGLNDKRKLLTKVLKENKFDKIIVENKDRLTRFGFNWFQLLTGNRIEVINETIDKDEDLVKDLISIIHCYSARIYGLRRSQNIKNQIKNVFEAENNLDK